jgi:hypothetical protein
MPVGQHALRDFYGDVRHGSFQSLALANLFVNLPVNQTLPCQISWPLQGGFFSARWAYCFAASSFSAPKICVAKTWSRWSMNLAS